MKRMAPTLFLTLAFASGVCLAADPVPAYPQPGRLEGTTAFLQEKDTPKKATKTHPEWLRGGGPNGQYIPIEV